MADVECPSCHQKTISQSRKMFLGPSMSTTCSNCGARISVPWPSVLATIPLLIAILATQYISSVAISAAVLVIGALALCLIQYKFVPLIVKS
jgi:hypothetical protein